MQQIATFFASIESAQTIIAIGQSTERSSRGAIMSAPVRGQYRADGPLLYAPRRLRRLAPAASERTSFTYAPPITIAPSTSFAPPTTHAAPPTAPEIAPDTEVPPLPRSRLFEGDVAIKDLRSRLARDPDLAPQPPIRTKHNSVAQWIGGWSFGLIMAAIALGTMLMVSPLGEVFRAETSARAARLPMTSQKELVNEPVPLAVSLDDAFGSATPLPDPSRRPAEVQPLDADGVAAVEHFLKNGDILSARILLKRAAGSGNAQAALELGMTFDPIFLVGRGVRGFASDPAEARAWYERAVVLGSTEASRNLERLMGMGQ
jgi:hypothetical protein